MLFNCFNVALSAMTTAGVSISCNHCLINNHYFCFKGVDLHRGNAFMSLQSKKHALFLAVSCRVKFSRQAGSGTLSLQMRLEEVVLECFCVRLLLHQSFQSNVLHKPEQLRSVSRHSTFFAFMHQLRHVAMNKRRSSMTLVLPFLPTISKMCSSVHAQWPYNRSCSCSIDSAELCSSAVNSHASNFF